MQSAAGPHNPHMEAGGVTGSGLASEHTLSVHVCICLDVPGQQCSGSLQHASCLVMSLDMFLSSAQPAQYDFDECMHTAAHSLVALQAHDCWQHTI